MQAVERLVTPSAGRLAALAPPWLQSSPPNFPSQGATTIPQHLLQLKLQSSPANYPLQGATTTPQACLQIKPPPQPGFLSPVPRSIQADVAHAAPASRTPSGHQAGTPVHPPFAIIR